ncbi:IS3 family transposase [Streptomyces nodosus]|uniref:IS3 family transposase n=1 Tax=Streptomyces nodosus TaxID=40318 RepID=UPI003456B20C
MISAMAEGGSPARRIIKLLGVSESGYYAWRDRTPSARSLRHAWLTRIILDIYLSSGSTFGYRRIRQELGRRYGVKVSHGTVELLMSRTGIRGRAGPLRDGGPAAVDGVPSRRWIIDVFACAAPESALCTAVVLDVTSQRLVSWSAGPTVSALLVDRALDDAITREAAAEPVPDTVRGNLVGCSFTERAYTLRRMPDVGAVGDRYEHTIVDAFWENVRRELGDRDDGRHPKELEETLRNILEDSVRRE